MLTILIPWTERERIEQATIVEEERLRKEREIIQQEEEEKLRKERERIERNEKEYNRRKSRRRKDLERNLKNYILLSVHILIIPSLFYF
jgi:septin family protein